MELWAALASALAEASTEGDVLAIVADVAGPALGAELVNISLLDSDRDLLRLVTTRRTPAEVEEEFATYSATAPLPSTDALRTGRPVVLHDLAERDRRYPMLKDASVDQQSFAVVPLIFGHQPLGVLGLGWRDRQSFPPEQVNTLTEVARVCAAALDRALGHQRERLARIAAERTALRLAGLYTLTTRLASTVEAGQVAQIVVDVCMPALGATAATVTAYDGQHPAHQLAAHNVPAEIAEIAPQDFASLALINDVAASDAPVLVTSFADRDRRYPDLAGSQVRQQAWANLPLRAEERLVGIAAFGWDDPRDFSADDISFLQALASHTAMALDRAQLVATSLARAETLQALQQVTTALATAATRAEIAEATVYQAVGLVAEYIVMAYRDAETPTWHTVASPNVPADVAKRFATVTDTDSPLAPATDAAATARVITVNSREEIRRRYPAALAGPADTGTQSILAVPIQVSGKATGAIAFSFPSRGPVDARIRSVADTLVDLAGQALRRAELYETERLTAHELQQSLLPIVTTELPGVEAGVCYRPAQAGREVGGDWYDVFALPGGSVGFAVGDVAGHDLHAATLMARLQPLLRSVAVTGVGPAKVLEAMDSARRWISGPGSASVAFGQYDPAEGVLRYACAGHPYPLMMHGNEVAFLTEGRSMLVGIAPAERSEARISVPADSLLLWYSDGLIERRSEHLDVGFARLRSRVLDLPRPGDARWAGPQAWAEAVLDTMTSDYRPDDDIALICLHVQRLRRD